MKVSKTVQVFLRDSDGKVVIWQTPNALILVWLAAMAVANWLTQGALQAGFRLLSEAVLFTWAYLELTAGVNYFRRTLGAVVIVALIAKFFQ